MGWCSGSYLCKDIWEKIRDYVPEENRVQVLGEMINRFSDEDADCWDALIDIPEFEEAMKIAGLHDLYFDEE
jgi:hypothetical protein